MYHELLGPGLCNGKNPLAGWGERREMECHAPPETDKELKKHTFNMVPWRNDWCTHLVTRSIRPKGSELKTRAGTNLD